jgi:hypothetical protein
MIYNQIGLIINFIGSIFIAISFGIVKTNVLLVDINNKSVKTVALKHPYLFRWGIIFVIIGFGLMFFSTFLQ